MRIRGRARTTSYLERGAGLLDLQPVPLDLSTFQNFSEFHLEVGSGRGTFLQQMATLNPYAYFVGIEKFVPIVARAAALSASHGLKNVHFYRMDVGTALSVLPQQTFAKIYLNFSDPWPKRRQEKNRLTHPRFLEIYTQLLARTGRLELKTDNEEFFLWSLASLRTSGWRLFAIDKNVTGIAPSGLETSGRFVHTEYESRFRALGQPIFAFYAHAPE